IRAGYHLLDLITYFTVGPKETRAWTIVRGTKAPQAAGVIHTDFERGFIRAFTIAYDDYIAFKGEVGAKEAGKGRAAGKGYVVQDGDVIHFRAITCSTRLSSPIPAPLPPFSEGAAGSVCARPAASAELANPCHAR